MGYFLILLPLLASILIAYFVLPTNCSIDGYQDSGLSCDSIPNSCCPANNPSVTAAQIAVVVGLVLSVIIGYRFSQAKAKKQLESMPKILD
jgi:hypothetical protein